MNLVLLSTPIGFLGSGKGGGVELTLNSLVSGLLSMGHNIKVVAPQHSKLNESNNSADLYCVDGFEQESWQHKDYFAKDITSKGSLVHAMFEKAVSFVNNSDVILNFSYDFLPINETLKFDIPIAHLISMGDESFEISNVISKVYKRYPNNFAFHSLSQARDFPFIQNPNIVGNGFELSNYKFQDCKDGPLAWVGRVAPEKGLEDAVHVANELGEKLKVWGFIQDQKYAANIEKNYPKGLISWQGFLETNELQLELGKCRALINTPKWNEAYGNVVVEAMSCGVPVVAYERGGPSELINHGETGFLVPPDDKKSLTLVVKRINEISRKKCREWVEENASSKIFANKVSNWLERVVNGYKIKN